MCCIFIASFFKGFSLVVVIGSFSSVWCVGSLLWCLSCCGARVVRPARFSSCSSRTLEQGLLWHSCSVACGILPDRGLNHVPCISMQVHIHCATTEVHFKRFFILTYFYPVFGIHLFIFNLKERPRSAVEQLCLAESTRPRMTVEEQMERIRRHQQACLREKKKGLNLIGALDQSPLPSPSNLRDNPFRITQVFISVVFTHSCG